MRLQSYSVETKQGIETRSAIYQYRGDERWLSNFWPCQVILPAEEDLPAMIFDNVEKAYMAWKTTDQSVRDKIQTMTPGDAKKLSHTPEFVYREPYTDDMRIAIMENLVGQKFGMGNPGLMEKLMETKNDLLAEGNVHGDTFFGIDLDKGYGLNHLGRIQMRVREKRLKEFTENKKIVEIDPLFAWGLISYFDKEFEGIPHDVGKDLDPDDKRAMSFMMMWDGSDMFGDDDDDTPDTLHSVLQRYGFNVNKHERIAFQVNPNSHRKVLPK